MGIDNGARVAAVRGSADVNAVEGRRQAGSSSATAPVTRRLDITSRRRPCDDLLRSAAINDTVRGPVTSGSAGSVVNGGTVRGEPRRLDADGNPEPTTGLQLNPEISSLRPETIQVVLQRLLCHTTVTLALAPDEML